MILRTSLSNTKKFFKKSIESIKSYFSRGYERLPKSPPCNPFSCGAHMSSFSHSYRELENIYSEFVDQWEGAATPQADNLKSKKESSLINQYGAVLDRRQQEKKKRIIGDTDNGCQRKDEAALVREREERSCLVTSKLKELEMMDMDNVDHVLDIQEVLYYYSGLTCPAYREIIEKFFMEMYSDLFCLPYAGKSVSSCRLIQT